MIYRMVLKHFWLFNVLIAMCPFEASAIMPNRCSDLFQIQSRAKYNHPPSTISRWSQSKVYTSDGRQSFAQEEVLLYSLQPTIRKRTQEILQLSGNDRNFESVEYGFYLVVLKNGEFLFGENVSSNLRYGITAEASEPSLYKLLQNLSPKEIDRIQFYHTHPGGRSSQSLSPADMDATVELQHELASRGIFCSLDIYAISHDLAYGGIENLYQMVPHGQRSGARPSVLYKEILPVMFRATIEPE